MPRKKQPNKAVQISIDPKLLKEIDADEEARASGRSAFIVRAILTYMRVKRAKEIDDNLIATLGPRADEIFQEGLPMMESQVWPPDDDLVEDHQVPSPRKRHTAGR